MIPTRRFLCPAVLLFLLASAGDTWGYFGMQGDENMVAVWVRPRTPVGAAASVVLESETFTTSITFRVTAPPNSQEEIARAICDIAVVRGVARLDSGNRQ